MTYLGDKQQVIKGSLKHTLFRNHVFCICLNIRLVIKESSQLSLKQPFPNLNQSNLWYCSQKGNKISKYNCYNRFRYFPSSLSKKVYIFLFYPKDVFVSLAELEMSEIWNISGFYASNCGLANVWCLMTLLSCLSHCTCLSAPTHYEKTSSVSKLHKYTILNDIQVRIRIAP